MARRKSGYVSLRIDDVLSEVDDDVLLDEVRDRELIAEAPEFDAMDIVREAYAELLCGRSATARVILERLVHPKWDSSASCARDYVAWKNLFQEGGAAPQSRSPVT